LSARLEEEQELQSINIARADCRVALALLRNFFSPSAVIPANLFVTREVIEMVIPFDSFIISVN
jgi:hypothetical protein